MKKTTALAIQVPSKPGVLAEVIRALEEESVTIQAMSAPDAVGAGIIRLLVDSLDKARTVLNQLEYPFSLESVFVLTCQDWDEVRDIITRLGIARINIEFCFSSDGKTYVLGTDNIDRTEELLKR